MHASHVQLELFIQILIADIQKCWRDCEILNQILVKLEDSEMYKSNFLLLTLLIPSNFICDFKYLTK